LTGYLSIVRWNGALGDYSSLFNGGVGSLPVPVDGDVLRAEIVGNVITVYRNGVAVKSVNVTSIGSPVWSAGQPGIGFWPVDSSTPANYGWKSYTAGNL